MVADETFSTQKRITRKKDAVGNADCGFKSTHLFNVESGTRYDKIVEECGAIIFTHDLKGKLLTMNSAALNSLSYLGEAPDDLLISSIIPELLREDFSKNYFSLLRKQRSSHGVMQVLTRYGRKKSWLYHSNLSYELGEQPFVICFAQDITERVQVEDALRLSNDTFRSVFDYSGIGMALISPEGNLLDANSAMCSFLGFSKAELLTLNFMDLTHPEDKKTDEVMLQKMLTKMINHYSIEKRYISKSKKILWSLHTVSKVAHEDSSPKFFVLQVVDITRKKELADELNRKNSELEAVKSGLINKINQLEELNYIIAHNLRGPANNIKLLVDMLKTIDEPADDSVMKLEMGEIVEFLQEGTDSLLGSLNTLMDVVQISMNKSIPYDDCDAKKIVYDILSQLNSSIFEKNASIKGNINITHIHYPKVFLESILYNLISNALKYSSKERRPEIVVSTYSVDGRVILSVKDNGLGLNLDKHGSKLFKLNQIFHPGHDSKGVGLFITKAQIESFGGNIKVKSKEGEGSEFIVTL